MQPKWGQGWIFTSRIQYKQQLLIKKSLLENKSRYVIILHNQALPKFYIHERSWHRDHGGKMYAHGYVFLAHLSQRLGMRYGDHSSSVVYSHL